MRKKVAGGTLILGLLTGGAIPAPVPTNAQPTCEEVVAAYPGYRKITDQAVFVNPEFALRCSTVRPEEIEAARAKFGPHTNASVLIYMNDPAAAAFRNKAAYPVGSVVVKQKVIQGDAQDAERARNTDDGIGGMIKRAPGYDPAHGDWEYFYTEHAAETTGEALAKRTVAAPVVAAGKVEGGRITSCVQCHEGAKGTDYVFGTWADPGNPFGRPASLKLR